MLIAVSNPTSDFSKPRQKRGMAPNHLMLAGIDQVVFLQQWGEPETQIGLNRVGSSCKLGSFFLIVNPSEGAQHSVWIYKKKDRILFFTKKRLTSHFKWTEFKESSKRPREAVNSGFTNRSTSLMVTTLALVA